jgi:hypothetical protein
VFSLRLFFFFFFFFFFKFFQKIFFVFSIVPQNDVVVHPVHQHWLSLEMWTRRSETLHPAHQWTRTSCRFSLVVAKNWTFALSEMLFLPESSDFKLWHQQMRTVIVHPVPWMEILRAVGSSLLGQSRGPSRIALRRSLQ